MSLDSGVAFEILLVDDSPTDVMIAKEALALSRIPSRVHVVSDGDEALDFLLRRGKHADAPRPALVFLDLHLPRRSGLEVLAIVKADADLKSIPIIVLTTSHAPNDIEKSYRSHANCYLIKPVDFDRLSEVVQATQNYWLKMVTLPVAASEKINERI